MPRDHQPAASIMSDRDDLGGARARAHRRFATYVAPGVSQITCPPARAAQMAPPSISASLSRVIKLIRALPLAGERLAMCSASCSRTTADRVAYAVINASERLHPRQYPWTI